MSERRIGTRWTPYNEIAGRRERRPLAECPNCGQYQYTTLQRWGLLGGKQEWNECRGCGYAPNHPRERV